MARLKKEEIQQLFKTPKNRNNIEFACLQEEWLRMHGDPILQKQKLPPRAYLEFSTWVRSFITEDKTARVLSLLNTPFETVAVVKSIFDQLGKFFGAQDRFMKVEFTSEELETDFHSYLDKIKDAQFWPTKGMDALRIAINAILVCDLPATQKNEKPEPYYYLLDLRNVVDIELNKKTDAVEYLILKEDSHTLVVLDDEFFRVYKARLKSKDGGVIQFPYVGHLADNFPASVDNLDTADFDLISEIQHSVYTPDGDLVDGLGYCPAIDFYGCVISGTNRIDKRGPITDVITKLNFLLFFLTLAKYYQLYGPFPIICSFKIKDKNFDDKNMETVDTGTSTISLNQFSAYDLVSVDAINPRKQPRNLIGPGTSIQVPGMQQQGDPDYLANGPLKIIEMQVDNLDWVKNYVSFLGNDIKRICTGQRSRASDEKKKDPSYNEDQIGEGLEEQNSILDNIGAQFERCHQFALQTLAILRYSRKYFVSASIDYGSEYFLKTPEQLTNELQTAIKAGMSRGYLTALKRGVITTKFKNNGEQLNRQKILMDVEPYIGLTWMEMKEAGMNEADWTNFVIKLNFDNFVCTFESEYGNIVAFMSKMDYKLKIGFIQDKFKQYGSRIVKPAIPAPVTGTVA